VLFLFDANVLITASNTYYPIDLIPEFWSWVEHQGKIENIKIPWRSSKRFLPAGKTVIHCLSG
jgi:hypothetical protein